MKHIISYDFGTGGIKTSLFDENGYSKADTFASYDTDYSADGFHEQRPSDWWSAFVLSTKKLLSSVSAIAEDIVCLAISGHGLGAVPVGADGSLLTDHVPIWTDTRAKKQAEIFFKKVPYKEWYMNTGAGFPPPHYAIFKMMWYKENQPEIYAKTGKFLGTKDYINFVLTGNMMTDYSYASGSGVYSLKDWDYCEQYIKASGVERSKLPDLVSSSHVVGTLREDIARELGLKPDVTVSCGGNDTTCMALGAGCIGDGAYYTSIGTSSWIAACGEDPVLDFKRKPYVFAHCMPGMYISSTAIFSAGSTHRWLKDVLCKNLVEQAKKEGKNVYGLLDQLAKTSPVGAKGLLFNPSLAGGSGLDRSANIRGSFMGLDLTHNQADIIRSVLEGICLNLRFAMDVLNEYVKISGDMLLVGGGGNSAFWRGLFADIFHKNIRQTNVGQNAGALGAAAVAAVGAGLWKDYAPIGKIHKTINLIRPNEENAAKYETILKTYIDTLDIQCDIGDMIAKMKSEIQ